jgi:hypothetical protein
MYVPPDIIVKYQKTADKDKMMKIFRNFMQVKESVLPTTILKNSESKHF